MTKYEIKNTTQFKKDYKLAKRRGLDINLLKGIITKLANGEVLAPKHKDHPLSGDWVGHREGGMNLSTAFNIFVRQSLRERGIPFKITEGTPSKETVSAMLEAERIAKDPTVKGYHDVDEFFANLDS